MNDSAVAERVAEILSPTIPTWSHSRMTDFEKCRHMAFLKYVKKIPEPERPLPPGKSEHANDRGSRIHEESESFVNGSSDYLPIEAAKHFTGEMFMLRHLHSLGMVSLEGEWAFDRDWRPTSYSKRDLKEGERPPWLRLKLDAIVHWSEEWATAIDYKSGRKFGNEIKHGEQLSMYSIATFLRYPKLQFMDTELWYFDQNEVSKRTITRDQCLRFLKGFEARGNKITTATEFPASPSKFACQWCPYNQTEHCTVGVKRA